MQFKKVTIANIKDLYLLNKQLAIEEGQGELFTANFEKYSQGFLGNNPVAYGTLCFQSDKLIGFSVCNYKFSTYLGQKVLYIEDIYLMQEFAAEENKKEFLQHLIEEASQNDCARVEMRILENFNWGINLLNDLGFTKIDKWSVYRQ